MKATMFIGGRKYQVTVGQDGYFIKTNLPFPVKIDIENNKLVAVAA